MTAHGRRIGELIACRPVDFDPTERTLALGRTKNGSNVTLQLAPEISRQIDYMPNWRERDRLFGFKWDEEARKQLRRACHKADVPYYTPHKAGRHAFAVRMLRAGYSLQFVKEAGGWKTIAIVSQLYGHLAKSEVDEAVQKVARQMTSRLWENHRKGSNA